MDFDGSATTEDTSSMPQDVGILYTMLQKYLCRAMISI